MITKEDAVLPKPLSMPTGDAVMAVSSTGCSVRYCTDAIGKRLFICSPVPFCPYPVRSRT